MHGKALAILELPQRDEVPPRRSLLWVGELAPLIADTSRFRARLRGHLDIAP